MFRAASDASTLHDSSYLRTIELSGPQQDICSLLEDMLDPLMARPSSQRYLPGHRYGNSIFYDTKVGWPFGVVGPVEFLWQQLEQQSGADGQSRKLWIFVHPSIHAQVHNVLSDAVSMNGIVYPDALKSLPQTAFPLTLMSRASLISLP